MRLRILSGLSLICLILMLASLATAQFPAGPGGGGGGGGGAGDLINRMMAFDKNEDGKLSKDEVTDSRLTRLFDRADTDKDGVVTRDELTALAAREPVNDRGGPRGGPGGGPGGPMMGFPRPGEILPPMLQQRLGLSDDQKTQLAALQSEVDARLAKILTDEQQTQLKTMRQRGPGGGPGGPGFGPPGGPGGPGGGFGGGPGRRGGGGPPPPPPGDGPPPE